MKVYLQNFIELIFLYYFIKCNRQLVIFGMIIGLFFVVIEFKKTEHHFLILLFSNYIFIYSNRFNFFGFKLVEINFKGETFKEG